MKARVIALLAGAGLVTAAATVCLAKHSVGFKDLKQGMTKGAVRDILGEPSSASSVSCFGADALESWIYREEIGFGPIVWGSRRRTVLFEYGRVTEKAEHLTRKIHLDWKRKKS